MQPCVVHGDGHVVWDNDSYAFLSGEAPPSVNPSLWRQSQLVTTQGLFEVVDGIYQVRALDLSNVTFVEGDTGVIVIDPLLSTETASAALKLYRAHAVAENVYADTAMNRRAGYMYGAALERGPHGQVGCGLGQTISTGTVTLIAPTMEITTTGQEEVIDGVRMIFQMAPGTEAPAEMHFYFPDRKALCMAENATHTQHNLLTLRGALERDPHVWSRYPTEVIALFGHEAEVAFASPHCPRGATPRSSSS